MLLPRTPYKDATRSRPTKRRTLAQRAANRWPSTRSYNIAIAFRPRRTPSTIGSGYGSDAFVVAGFYGGAVRRAGAWRCPRP